MTHPMPLVIRHSRACGISGVSLVTLPAAPWERGEPMQRPARRAPPVDAVLAARIVAALQSAGRPLRGWEVAKAAKTRAARVLATLDLLRATGTVVRVAEARKGTTAHFWRLP